MALVAMDVQAPALEILLKPILVEEVAGQDVLTLAPAVLADAKVVLELVQELVLEVADLDAAVVLDVQDAAAVVDAAAALVVLEAAELDAADAQVALDVVVAELAVVDVLVVLDAVAVDTVAQDVLDVADLAHMIAQDVAALVVELALVAALALVKMDVLESVVTYVMQDALLLRNKLHIIPL